MCDGYYTQFLYGKYHIWDDQGTHNADSTEKFIALFVCSSPKIWDIIEKGFIGCPLSLSTEEKTNDER